MEEWRDIKELEKLVEDLFGNMLKRFQYYSREGIKWSDWFQWNSDVCPKYQLASHPKLLNEYKEG